MAKINNVVVTFRLGSPTRDGPCGDKYLYSKKAIDILDVLGQNSNYKLKACKNFTTARDRHSPIAFIIFHSGCVNITGIPTLEKVHSVIQVFNTVTDSKIDMENVRVANIVASGIIPMHSGERLCLRTLFTFITSQQDNGTVSIASHLFSGMYYRRPKSATLHIFSNGKYNITGAKSLADVHNSTETLTRLIGDCRCVKICGTLKNRSSMTSTSLQ